MASTYSEAEIIQNVFEIAAGTHSGMLSYLENPDDDYYSAHARGFSNTQDGVSVEIMGGTHQFREITIGAGAKGSHPVFIDSKDAPMTCLIARPNKQHDNRKTIVRCAPDTKDIAVEDILTGMRGYKGVFNGLGLDAEETGIHNLYEDLGIDESESLYKRHRLIQLASPEEKERNHVHFTRRFYIEEAIRKRLTDATQRAIAEEARHNTEDMPKIVYRKVNSDYLLDCLYHNGCVNSSGTNSWSRSKQHGEHVREDPRHPPELSFSEKYLERCELFTPAERQEVTMVMRIPETACPLRLKYTKRAEDLYDTDEGYMYPIVVRKHLEETCPACDCIDEAYVKNWGQSSAWHEESEIIITECNSGRVHFEPEDVLHLVVETQCGVDFDKIKEKVELVVPEYAHKLITFEEWEKKYAKTEA